MSLRFKHQILAAGSALTFALLSAPVAAYAQVNYDFNVPAGSLADSLRAIGAKAGANIAFDPAIVGDKRAPALRGSFSVKDALGQVVAGSGLIVRPSGTNAFIVEAPGSPPGGRADAGDARETSAMVAEVVVTAEKRSEDVRKVSGSVTAYTGKLLETLGAQGLQDYLTMTPGVAFNGDIPGESRAVIRGISTTTHFDQGQATAGYYINDVPLADPYFTVSIPDIDAFDVDNVVVLRGPQGTLFGSAALGGAINYQAAKPNLTRYQVHAQATAETIQKGGTGGSGKLMVNLPIVNDRFAVRAVYVYRQDPGFIDNVGTGQKDANSTLIRGGRFEAAWAPTSSTTLNYMYLDQSEDTADLGYQAQSVGPLQKSTAFPEFRNFRTQINTLRVDQDLGFGTLTAMGSYFRKTQSTDQDATIQFDRFLPGIHPVHGPQDAYSKGTNFELRLASKAGQRFEYIIGVMHTDTRENFVDTYSADNATQTVENDWSPVFGPGIGATAPNNVFFYGYLPFHGRETAAFGEATYHFNDQWKLTLGGREFQTESNNTATSGGFLNLLSTGELETTLYGSQKETGFTPKASITWTPNGDLMAYALVSKGFRFGGPNINPSTPGNPIPPTFGSDSLWNYEAGIRSNFFDHRLLVDLTAFYIDWSNIQLRVATPSGQAYGANAGRATNYGFEGTTTWLITDNLSLQTNLTYLQAALATDFDPGAGQPVIPDGSVLPGTAKWQVSNILGYHRDDLPGRPQLILTHRYASNRAPDYIQPIRLGGYSLFDARAAFHLRDDLNLSLYVNNIGDSRATSGGSFFPVRLEQRYLFQPRTFGLTIDYKM